MRDIGTTMCGHSSADDNKTLASVKFQVGDFLDISITSPQRDSQRDRILDRVDRIDRGPPPRRDRMNHRY